MSVFALFSLLFFAQVPQYGIECDPDQFQYMMDNYDEEIVIPCTVEHQGTVYENCTMRIRGDTSREFRKKSYRIEFPPDQPHLGRTRWNFNADYLDFSYIRAWLFSRVLGDMGFPCFQVSHARLDVNGEYRGLFMLLEPVNESFLERNGINTLGNLYKARRDGACASIHDDVDSLWSKMTNESSGMNDLLQLIEGIESCPPENFEAFMDSAFTMYGPRGLIRMLAINAAFANNSTYYHNYYLYNDVLGDGKWIMLPWDVDRVLSKNIRINYAGCTNQNWYDNPIHARTLTVPGFREAFTDTVETIFSHHLTPEKLQFWCDSLEVALHDAVEQDTWDDTDIQGFHEALQELRGNLGIRISDLQWQFQYKYHPFRSLRSDSLATGSLTVSWLPTEDPSGVPAASYTVILRDSLGTSSDTLAMFEGIQDTLFTITGLDPGEYWWTVETGEQAGWRVTEATDRYNPFTVVNPVVLTGTLPGNTTLYRALSPYSIPGEVTVPQGGTLQIEAGVTILMGENGAVNCLGSIISGGTPTDSVVFIAENSLAGWRGIRMSGGSLDMSHTVVSGSMGYAGEPGADFAGVATHSSEVVIRNSVFRDNWSCLKVNGGTAQVDSCIFTDNRGELFFLGQGDSGSVTNSLFRNLTDPVADSMDGIEFQLCTEGSFTVDNCVVQNMADDGIDINASTVTISNTRISDCADKGFSLGAPTSGGAGGTLVTIENCVTEGSATGAAVKDGASAVIGNTLFRDCETALHVYDKTTGSGGHATVSSSIFTLCGRDVFVEEGTASVQWSISDGGLIPGQGNTTGDPGLDSQGRLVFSSPCIDAGDPDMEDPDGSRLDMGPYFYPVRMNGLCVNEVMARNDTVIQDDWGRFSDWIELFNGTSYDLDAGVLVFSAGDTAWSVPRGTMIPSGGFMLFWADEDAWKGGNHLPFTLAAGGDTLSLGRIAPGETPRVSPIEEVGFQDQTADISLGRFPDGGQWRILENPTPGYSNGTLYSVPVLLGSPRPNPCFTGLVTMDVTVAGGETEVLAYDLAGRRVATVFDGHCQPGLNTFTWNTSRIPAGLYLIFARCAGQLPASGKVTVLR